MDSDVASKGNHQPDTGVVSISKSGCVHPYFIEHSPQKTQKVNLVRNPEGTVIMIDRLRSHTNKDIQNILESHNVKCFHLHPQGEKLGSVCDNSFFIVLKSRMQKINTLIAEKKREAFFQLCNEFPQEMVKKFYRHCG